jgi:hypothetical protein
MLRAPCSSRWHAAESRPGKPDTAAARQVPSTSNFGTGSATRTICVAVNMIGNSAGMIVLPYFTKVTLLRGWLVPMISTVK